MNEILQLISTGSDTVLIVIGWILIKHENRLAKLEK